MPHRKTPITFTRHQLALSAFYDRDRAELVNLTEGTDLLPLAVKVYPDLNKQQAIVDEIVDFQRGDVLADNRGNGTFQKIVVEKPCLKKR